MRRLPLGLACLFAVSATGPQTGTIQVFDQRGLPVEGVVIEVPPPPGSNRPIAFPWRSAMAQRNQTFVPGTLIVPQGANVAFPNLDTVRHSIYSFSKPARFQIDLYGRDQTRSQRFAITGTVALGCNIHDKMRGYIRVVSTPYAAATDLNGRGQIEGLAPGTYRVTVWHPRLRGNGNEAVQTIKIAPGSTTRLSIELR
ncbi:plastocyanin/azurin family domain protein [Novosphingobium fuchskuhlense]|uniref:Plastocyanin/azurin family domain protein n=1 Tax=Novosphingobium fuchskuhlense TaxID=1117702 RepID=A0A117UVL4_9SPHN|nr:plastocyanin/azurin family domain protein [Novosphingobium fuchskuhlense]KUR71667.1 plastocyanin/azurin family domain protein [Novosphingobium fuchskuhlense]